MGSTHFRSDVREKGARTASFSTITAGTISGTVTGNVTGNLTVASSGYVKLGTVYLITGKPTAFTNAGINAIATANIGATPSDIPQGTLFMNASLNMNGSTAIYTKVGVLGSWCAGFSVVTLLAD